MCWSTQASLGVAAAAICGTAFAYKKGKPKDLCVVLSYFTLMEVLQAYTYLYIDECGTPQNQIATLLGYYHIAFQPFFINAVSLHFIPKKLKEKIQFWVYTYCFIAAILYLIRIYPFDWARSCVGAKYSFFGLNMFGYFAIPFCGQTLCSVTGQWHLAWQAPAMVNFWMETAYVFSCFLLPFLYGSWKMTIYHIIVGPLLAFLTTNNSNEFIAVWCLYSVGILGLLTSDKLRGLLYVRGWYRKNIN